MVFLVFSRRHAMPTPEGDSLPSSAQASKSSRCPTQKHQSTTGDLTWITKTSQVKPRHKTHNPFMHRGHFIQSAKKREPSPSPSPGEIQGKLLVYFILASARLPLILKALYCRSYRSTVET
jgi:hypothetical protein